MKQFIVAEGRHFDEKGKEFNKGDKVKSPYDLNLIFPSKFIEDSHYTPTKEDKSETEVSHPKQKSFGKVDDDSKTKSFGKDRTIEFDSAKEAGLKVYLDNGAYTVVDPSAPTVALNTEPLKAAFVDLFIEKYQKIHA